MTRARRVLVIESQSSRYSVIEPAERITVMLIPGVIKSG